MANTDLKITLHIEWWLQIINDKLIASMGRGHRPPAWFWDLYIDRLIPRGMAIRPSAHTMRYNRRMRDAKTN